MNIIQGLPTPQKDYYKVYVRSITYNQSQYIEDCLNGVAMQKTGFPFIHHVIDDCSTDGEQEVIKAWMERECDMNNAEYYDNDISTITLAKHKSNPSYTIAAYFLKRNLYREQAEKDKLYSLWREICPYEAICEGDDYWISSEKLQHQIDFLSLHPECSAVFGNRITTNENKTIVVTSFFNKTRYNIDDIMFGVMPGLQNIAYRTINMDGFILPGFNGDMCLYLRLAQNGIIANIREDWAIYRKTGHGVATGRASNISWRISLEHRFQLHKVLGFKYNKQLVKSQVYNIMDHILAGERLREGLSYVRMYACPNKVVYFWSPLYIIKYCLQSLIRRYFGKKGYLKY